jgi:uncharacterized protein YjbI with pentapeptide repeats
MGDAEGGILPSLQKIDLTKYGKYSIDDWHKSHPSERLNLSGKDLSGLDLSGWDFTRAIFDGSDLSQCKLVGTIFSEASLKRTNLTGAVMTQAILHRANCSDSTIVDVKLDGANMYRCVLKGADISGTTFKAAHVLKVVWPNISNSRGLRDMGVISPIIDL